VYIRFQAVNGYNGTQQLYTVYDGKNPYIDFNGNGTLTERYLTNPNALNQQGRRIKNP
jgi:hypothetical protein